MEKKEKIFYALATLTGIGVIIFWVACFNDYENIAITALLSATLLWIIARYLDRDKHHTSKK